LRQSLQAPDSFTSYLVGFVYSPGFSAQRFSLRCYLPGMSRDKKNPITSEKLKEVMDTHKINLQRSFPKPAPAPMPLNKPLKPAEDSQDAGGGYNTNHVFPQR
jgi:hypothetical protein